MRQSVEGNAGRTAATASSGRGSRLSSRVTADELRSTYWPYALSRAITFAALAIAITFSQDHSATFGLAAFAVFAFISSVIGVIFARSGARMFRPARVLIAQSAVSVAAAVLAGSLAVLALSDALSAGGASTAGASIRSLLVVLAGWAAITGSLDVFLGLRSRGRHPGANDWVSMGAFTMLAALVFVLLPPDFRQQFVGEQKVSGVLDSAIITVGLLGAYAAISAVFLVIAALSARWAKDALDPASPVTESESR